MTTLNPPTKLFIVLMTEWYELYHPTTVFGLDNEARVERKRTYIANTLTNDELITIQESLLEHDQTGRIADLLERVFNQF